MNIFRNNSIKPNFRLSLLLFFIILLASSSNLCAELHIKAVGDIMLGSLTPKRIIPKGNGEVYKKHVGGMLSYCDISFGNLEGAFVNSQDKPCKCSDSSRQKKHCFEFGFPSNLVLALKDLGLTILNMDNNHGLDYGFSAYQYTQKLLESYNIKSIPFAKYTELNIKQKKIAFISFGFDNNSFHISDIPNVSKRIRDLKQRYKLVFVSFHGGKEGKQAVHIPDGKEIFLGEDRGDVVKFAHAAIDAGADLVIGSGPHVLRGFELYNNKFIAYSLGNFLTYGNVNIDGVCGVSCILDLKIDENSGDFMSGEIIPMKQMKPGIPYYDSKMTAVKLLKKLCVETDKSNSIIINDAGKIRKK